MNGILTNALLAFPAPRPCTVSSESPQSDQPSEGTDHWGIARCIHDGRTPAWNPPLMRRSAPVVNDAASLSKYMMAGVRSSGTPILPAGAAFSNICCNFGKSVFRAFVIGESITPGNGWVQLARLLMWYHTLGFHTWAYAVNTNPRF